MNLRKSKLYYVPLPSSLQYIHYIMYPLPSRSAHNIFRIPLYRVHTGVPSIDENSETTEQNLNCPFPYI